MQKRDWWIQTSLMMKALQRVSRLLFVVYFTVLVPWCQVKDRLILHLWYLNPSSSQKAQWSSTSTTSSRGNDRRWRGGSNLRVYGIQVPSSSDSCMAESHPGLPFPIQHWSLHRWDLQPARVDELSGSQGGIIVQIYKQTTLSVLEWEVEITFFK